MNYCYACPCGFSVSSPYQMTTCWHCERDTLVTIPEDDFPLNPRQEYVVFEYQEGRNQPHCQESATIERTNMTGKGNMLCGT